MASRLFRNAAIDTSVPGVLPPVRDTRLHDVRREGQLALRRDGTVTTTDDGRRLRVQGHHVAAVPLHD